MKRRRWIGLHAEVGANLARPWTHHRLARVSSRRSFRQWAGQELRSWPTSSTTLKSRSKASYYLYSQMSKWQVTPGLAVWPSSKWCRRRRSASSAEHYIMKSACSTSLWKMRQPSHWMCRSKMYLISWRALEEWWKVIRSTNRLIPTSSSGPFTIKSTVSGGHPNRVSRQGCLDAMFLA